jgi:hypothetical protein
MRKVYLILITCIFFVTISCKVEVPSPDAEKIFGTWRLIGTGYPYYPIDKTQQIEFKRNGIFLKYSQGKRIEKRRFQISENKSMVYKNAKYQIDYNDDAFSNVPSISQIVYFQGNDTLSLQDDGYDAQGAIYVRK